MTSKERVKACIAGKSVDRVPFFMWYSRKTTENLAKALGIQSEEVDDALQNDVKQDWLSINKQMNVECAEGKTFVDEWGITWQRDGEYNTVVRHPLALASAEEIAAYPFPQAEIESRYIGLKNLMQRYPTHFIGADVSGSIFEPAYHLRGMENLLMDMAMEEKEADILLDRLEAFTTKVAVQALHMGSDWIWLGDDFGTQQNLIASPSLWRKYCKPRYKRIIEALQKVQSDVIVAFHSCGSVRPILGDLCEIGVQVINPLQESAKGMDHAEIRKSFPEVTLFCGLDTQQYLVQAKPEDIYVAAKEKIRALGEKGRYIFGSSHTIQHDVPPENILAMIQAGLDA